MPSLRQELEKINTRVPITQFTYDPDTRKFRYRPTRQVWKRAGVDIIVGPVRHEGVVMRASEWLTRYGERG